MVTATQDSSADGNLSTHLVGTVSDDGVPYDKELTYGWETVSAPEGAGVIYSDQDARETEVTGTEPGEYVFRFFGDDGEERSEATVTVTLTEREVSADLGASATITTTGTSGWENHQRVNDPDTPNSSSPGAGVGWGNWGQPLNGTSAAPGRLDPVRVGLAGAAGLHRHLLVRRQRRCPPPDGVDLGDRVLEPTAPTGRRWS